MTEASPQSILPPDIQNQPYAKKLVHGYELIIEALSSMGYEVDNANFKGTAERAAKGFAELVKKPAKVDQEVAAMLEKVFPAEDADEMICSLNNFCVGLCPHHLLPVIMRISVGYIPGKVIGISKLSRICKLLAAKPVLQESLTTQIAKTLSDGLDAKGSAARVIAFHTCAGLRGVKAHETQILTQKFYGAFKEQAETRAEFLHAVSSRMIHVV